MTRPSDVMAVSRNASPRSLALALERRLRLACRIMAAGGALILLAIMLVVVASVVRRSLLSGPIPGDYELVEFGMAIAITAFLPYCQIERGNVIVDFFTDSASHRTKQLLEAVGNLIYLLIAALITWRLVMGGIDTFRWGGDTMVLRLPNWWAFPPMVLATALLTLVCVYSVFVNLRSAFYDRD
jgi:TRAP-type C4-dicarboxylate transport system permease small subunit